MIFNAGQHRVLNAAALLYLCGALALSNASASKGVSPREARDAPLMARLADLFSHRSPVSNRPTFYLWETTKNAEGKDEFRFSPTADAEAEARKERARPREAMFQRLDKIRADLLIAKKGQETPQESFSFQDSPEFVALTQISRQQLRQLTNGNDVEAPTDALKNVYSRFMQQLNRPTTPLPATATLRLITLDDARRTKRGPLRIRDYRFFPVPAGLRLLPELQSGAGRNQSPARRTERHPMERVEKQDSQFLFNPARTRRKIHRFGPRTKPMDFFRPGATATDRE